MVEIATKPDAGSPSLNNLPRTLRIKIWELCLPPETGSVFCYRDWKWRISDKNQPAGEIAPQQLLLDNIGMIYPHVEVLAPTIFVNREARAVTLQWSRQQQFVLSIHRRKTTGKRVIIRPWDGHRDALYIPCDKWDGFVDQALNYDKRTLGRLWFTTQIYPALKSFYDRPHYSDYPAISNPAPTNVHIKNLALPSDILDSDTKELAVLLNCLPNLRTIYVVFGKLPCPWNWPNELVHERWELVDALRDNTDVDEYAFADNYFERYYKINNLDRMRLDERIRTLWDDLTRTLTNYHDRRPNVYAEQRFVLQPVQLRKCE